MTNSIAVAIDQHEAVSTHHMHSELHDKFCAAERQHWIWTLIVSTVLTRVGLAVWLASRS